MDFENMALKIEKKTNIINHIIMVAHFARATGVRVKVRESYEEGLFLCGILTYLGLISPSEDGFMATELGEAVYENIKGGFPEVYVKELEGAKKKMKFVLLEASKKLDSKVFIEISKNETKIVETKNER